MSGHGREKVLVYGAGGHAKVVIDVLEKQGRYEIALLVDDDDALSGKEFYGYQVAGGQSLPLAAAVRAEGLYGGIIAVGDNKARQRLGGLLLKAGLVPITAVHPSAQLARGAVIGEGTAIMAGAIVNSDAVIGPHVIVNTGAGIDHDCVIGSGVHIAPGSVLCGNVTVGDASLIGAGATLMPGIVIGRDVIVGAGAIVIEDVPDGATLIGSRIRKGS